MDFVDVLEQFKWFAIAANILLFVVLLALRHRVRGGDRTTQPSTPRKVLFVTAHPDDEAMFFTPTITTLANELGRELFLLCLSNGDFEGKGKVREKELLASCKTLGIPADRVFIIDKPSLKDGHNEQWNTEEISTIVSEHVARLGIQTIITFDSYGVSGHSNHIAVFRGVRRFLQLAKNNTASTPASGSSSPSTQPVPSIIGYSLISTNIVRKYIGLVDLPFSILHPLAYFPTSIWACHRAMSAHMSQYVWFRRLYVLFSRYAYINTLEEIDVQ